MKGTYMPIIVACLLLFSGCASREQAESVKENTSDKTEQKEALTEKETSTTTSENIFTSTTHQHNPEKTCEYPADAFLACSGKAENERCEYNSTGAILSGKCATEPCGKVVCKQA